MAHRSMMQYKIELNQVFHTRFPSIEILRVLKGKDSDLPKPIPSCDPPLKRRLAKENNVKSRGVSLGESQGPGWLTTPPSILPMFSHWLFQVQFKTQDLLKHQFTEGPKKKKSGAIQWTELSKVAQRRVKKWKLKQRAVQYPAVHGNRPEEGVRLLATLVFPSSRRSVVTQCNVGSMPGQWHHLLDRRKENNFRVETPQHISWNPMKWFWSTKKQTKNENENNKREQWIKDGASNRM